MTAKQISIHHSSLIAHRLLGWSLLILAFAWAAWLDPWALSERNPIALQAGIRPLVREGQAVVIALAFLHLMLGRILARPDITPSEARFANALTLAGTAIYVAGVVLMPILPSIVVLVPVGALVLLVGCVVAARACRNASDARLLQTLLLVVAFGFALDLAIGLAHVWPTLLRPAYLGPGDGVRLRMLRLARVAAVALPVLAFLFQEAEEKRQERRSRREKTGDTKNNEDVSGRSGFFCFLPVSCLSSPISSLLVGGAVGMPVVLSLAAFTWLPFKYLLTFPALAVVAGTFGGWRQARESASRLERWGWGLIGFSLTVGLFMGLYAFAGPFPTPPALGGYNEFPRRLERLGHAYCIILGLVCIWAARERGMAADEMTRNGGRSGVGPTLLMASTAVTIGAIALVALAGLPVAGLAIGPALTAFSLVLCLASAPKSGLSAHDAQYGNAVR